MSEKMVLRVVTKSRDGISEQSQDCDGGRVAATVSLTGARNRAIGIEVSEYGQALKVYVDGQIVYATDGKWTP